MVVNFSQSKSETGSFELKSGGSVNLRLLNAKDIKEMTEACVTVTPEYPYLPIMKDGVPQKDGQYVRFERRDVNQDLWNEMLWDRAITGWKDIKTENGDPVEVTKENKVLLMTQNSEFKETVDAGMTALKNAEKARTEASEKNSSAG